MNSSWLCSDTLKPIVASLVDGVEVEEACRLLF
jgi:hypothetical protein